MLRGSAIVGVLGLALLLASLVPWGARAAAPRADPEFGRALFLAKGCANCHTHAAVDTSGAGYWTTNEGPNLTAFTADPAYLRLWLRDPQGTRSTAKMPTLGLGESEIDALIAFLAANARRPK